MSRRLVAAIASVLIGIHLYLGWSFIKASAPTYDEPVHLASGYSYLVTGKYRLNIMDHPPLCEMVSAFPLIFQKVQLFPGHPYYAARQLYRYGDFFLYENTADPEKILNFSRLFSLVFWTILLAVFAGWWSVLAGGVGSALWALFFLALSPVFISNNSLVTTDAGSAVFYFISFFFAYLAFYGTESINPKSQIPNSKSEIRNPKSAFLCFVCSGVFTGLALASKFNMIILPFLVTGLAVLENMRAKRFRRAELAVFFTVYAAAALLVLAFVYRFSHVNIYFEVLSATLGRLEQGRSSFVFGRHTLKGVWWYFPLSLVIKTPLSFLILAAIGIFPAARQIKRGYLWIVLPPAIYFLVALTAKVQIGYRHILPVFPFLLLIAGAGADFLFRKRGFLRWVPAVLSAWMAVSVVRVHPHYIAYFNELAGGPSNGYKFLVDSNLDWGQGLKELSGFLRKEGNPPIFLSYFGVAAPAYYGLRTINLAAASNVYIPDTEKDFSTWDRILLAVSATNLQSTYYIDKHMFDWLKVRKPLYAAAYSIFVYDLTKDKDGLAQLADVFDRAGRNEEAKQLFERAGKL